MVRAVIWTVVLFVCAHAGETPGKRPEEKAPTSESSSQAQDDAEENGNETSGRADLNLVGKTDTSAGESRRNENVHFNPIDNNALKELNQRLGATATLVDHFDADQRYFGSELGNNPEPPMHVTPGRLLRTHGNLHFGHSNSIFSARSFFQVGDVKPARENDYGLTLSLPAWSNAFFTVDASQRKIRGNVNGNVLVPTADERTPLTNDPLLRPKVERLLAAYPMELPNRTDINKRSLNTNAPQSIDDDALGARLDQSLGSADRLAMRYRFTLQTVDAFQLVAGQNPNTTTRVHQSRVTWNRQWSPSTLTNLSAGFDRIGSLLVQDETAVGPLVMTGMEIEMLGPSSSIPIDRAQNLFRYGGEMRQLRGSHAWYAGYDVVRRQVNGIESSSHRGVINFTEDFDRDAVTNLRMGTASQLSGAIGHISRGFRNWDVGLFAGDDWRVNSNLTLTFGLRFEPSPQPSEVNGFNEIPYPCDCNNFAPRFGFAYRLPRLWGRIRAAYGLHYGQIFPVTYGQLRYNPPWNDKFEIEVPDLRLPLNELLESGRNPETKNTLMVLTPDLVVPYSHQYNFSWEPGLATNWILRLGYMGSRSPKLLTMWTFNRARPVKGIPQETDTVQERRPNPEFGELRNVLNGSFGYYDAARAEFILRAWKGLSFDTSYWFSKAIDLGANYTNTAAGRDAYSNVSQSEFDVHRDKKGLSLFDQPHSFLFRGTYEVPGAGGVPGWTHSILKDWRLGSVVLVKTGTPFSVHAGSDGPDTGNVDGSRGDRPNVVDPSVLGRTIGHPDASLKLLPAAAFSFMAPADVRGSLGSNTFRKGGIANVNAMLWRSFRFGNERELMFRAESVNFFNTPQFAEPGHSLSGDDFGYITNTLNEGRAFRFVMQLSF